MDVQLVFVIVQMFLLAITSGKTIQDPGCSVACSACKNITEAPEEYKGYWNLKAEVDPVCPSSCLYERHSDRTLMCFCDPGSIEYELCPDRSICYVPYRNCTEVVDGCKFGYECCYDGLACCKPDCPPIPENALESILTSDAGFYCNNQSQNCNGCQSGFECCHNDYCCPNACLPTLEDTIGALPLNGTALICNRNKQQCTTNAECKADCKEGAKKFADLICNWIKNRYAKAVCKFLLKHFSLKVCYLFCNKMFPNNKYLALGSDTA